MSSRRLGCPDHGLLQRQLRPGRAGAGGDDRARQGGLAARRRLAAHEPAPRRAQRPRRRRGLGPRQQAAQDRRVGVAHPAAAGREEERQEGPEPHRPGVDGPAAEGRARQPQGTPGPHVQAARPRQRHRLDRRHPGDRPGRPRQARPRGRQRQRGRRRPERRRDDPARPAPPELLLHLQGQQRHVAGEVAGHGHAWASRATRRTPRPQLRPGPAVLANSTYPVNAGKLLPVQVIGDWRDRESDTVMVEATAEGSSVDGLGRLNVLAPLKGGPADGGVCRERRSRPDVRPREPHGPRGRGQAPSAGPQARRRARRGRQAAADRAARQRRGRRRPHRARRQDAPLPRGALPGPARRRHQPRHRRRHDHRVRRRHLRADLRRTGRRRGRGRADPARPDRGPRPGRPAGGRARLGQPARPDAGAHRRARQRLQPARRRPRDAQRRRRERQRLAAALHLQGPVGADRGPRARDGRSAVRAPAP